MVRTAMFAGAKDELVGSYRLVRPLGRGGMGEVWLAEHVQIKSQVAIKLVLGDPNDNDAAARFLHEAKSTARIRHPGVVTVSDFGVRPAGGTYLVMELLDGESLAERLVRGALPIELATDLGLQIAEALAAAHAAGVVHRDLKPANVFLVPDPATRSGLRVKLLDFGVAKSTGKVTDELGLTVTGAIIGTPVYMAPEQCTSRRGPVDHRADLYALGVVLYEMVTGAPPFRGPTLGDLLDQHLNSTPTPPRSVNAAIPARLEVLILELLAKEREHRPATANDVVGALAIGADTSPRRETRPGPGLEATQAPGPLPVALDHTIDSRPGALAATVDSAARPAPSVADATLATASAPPSPAAGTLAAPPRRRTALVVVAIMCAALAVAVIGFVVLRGRTTPPALDLDRASDAELAQACDQRSGRACYALGRRESAASDPDLTRVFARMTTACDSGELEGCAHAAWMLLQGNGMRADLQRAKQYAERACGGNSALGCDLLGDAIARGALGAPDRGAALPYWKHGCELGAAGGCQSAASTLRHGLGVERDVAEAARLEAETLRTAERGCAARDGQSCRVAGHVFLQGLGIPADASRAGPLMLRACDLGSVEACAELGELHLLGMAVAKDPDRGRELLERGCSRGYASGCNTLALGHFRGLVGPPDPAKAFTLAHAACEQHGDAYCGTLGTFHAHGIGTPVDQARSKSYFDRACAAGDADACSGAASAKVGDQPRPDAEIERLVVRACALGSATGCYQLGLRERTRSDHVHANRHFDTACTLSGGQVGCPQLATAYFKGTGVKADPAKARAVLETGCNSGAPVTCHALGLRLRDGDGVAASPGDALAAFEKACGLGWGKACLAAEEMLRSSTSGVTQDPTRATEFHQRACTIEPVLCAPKPDSPAPP